MNSIIDIYNNIDFVIDINGLVWFKFLSICRILNYKSSKDTLRDHVFKENKIKRFKTNF